MLNCFKQIMTNFLFVLLVSVIGISILYLVGTVDGAEQTGADQCRTSECKQPTVRDPNLKVELFYQGIGAVSSMTFSGHDILLLDKNNGTVNRIVNGSILNSTLLDVNVANKRE
jgi:hypothetical protein